MEKFEHDELVALARLDIEQGRVEQGLAKLKSLLAMVSAPLEAIGMAARLYAQLGLFDRAQPLFEQYLASRPGAIEEEFQLGMVMLDRGQEDQALSIWDDMLKRMPTFPPGLFFSAVVLNRQGKIANARRNLEVLLQTAASDNLYYERSKELLQSIEQQVVHQNLGAATAYQG